MGRVSARKTFIYSCSVISLLYFIFALHIRDYQSKSNIQGQFDEAAIGDVIPDGGDKVIMLPDTNVTFVTNVTKAWYMEGGSKRPGPTLIDAKTGQRLVSLFPEEASGDRLINQLNFLPPELPMDQSSSDLPLKKILFWTGASGWGVKPGRGVFIKEQCPVSTCVISTKRKDSSNADLIIFKDHFIMPSFTRPKNQIWMIFMLESPLNTQQFKRPSVFNWTATYRSDSTLVTPYERWEYYSPAITAKTQAFNYAANKTKKVAWFVSNCAARNNRLEYARNLSFYFSKYIDVDIYGGCGDKQCPRSSKDCYQMLNTHYKFYLAFENSNCVDYITEKFYVNGLKYNVLPIVMGARKEDYHRVAPEKSFLHVDDFDGPEDLAKYLDKLDKSDDLYNEYFQWKGTGEMINTKFFCRLCALLHDTKPRPQISTFYEDINKWWRGKGTCIKGSWRKYHEVKNKNETKEQTA